MLLMSITKDFAGYVSGGGFVMLPLLLGTMLLWYALGYRYATLKRGNTRSVRRLVFKYGKGYSKPATGIIDKAVVKGLELVNQEKYPLRRYLDEEFSKFESEISKFGTLIRSIVRAAPLAGLLGTVTGMIETFNALGDMSLFSQSGGIAGGISQALISTQMGLAVAVPGLIAGRILDRKEQQLSMEIAQIKDILCTDEQSEAA